MSDTSARLGLPLIDPGQAQKETTHNEAIVALDLAVQACVVAIGVDTPPVSPVVGQAWVVGSAPDGAWIGHAGAIAGWTIGGWRFLAPREGLSAWCETTQSCVRYRSDGWETGVVRGAAVLIGGTPVVGAQRGAITEPAGGATVDARARAAITQILEAMRGHGLIGS